MASISAVPPSLSSSRACCRALSAALRRPPSSWPIPSPSRHSSLPSLRTTLRTSPPPPALRRTARAVAEEEQAQVSEATAAAEDGSPDEQPVSVPVSPSDMLTMFFKAEGTMDESATSAVSKALEGVEGVSDLKVQNLEGIASVELTKQTTVQATGVASNLVEKIQGSGFRLQTLNLSFEDEEDATN